jgi:hypothetical protein
MAPTISYVVRQQGSKETSSGQLLFAEEMNEFYARQRRRLVMGVALFSLGSLLSLCPLTYIASSFETQNGTATKAVRLVSPEYKSPVTLPDGFMPSCSDFNQIFEQDPSYSLRGIFGGCEVYPLHSSLDGKFLTVLFTDNDFVGRNLAPDGKFKLGIAKVVRTGGILKLFEYTTVSPECLSDIEIDRSNLRKYACSLDGTQYTITISRIGEIDVFNLNLGETIFQRKNVSVITNETSLTEKLKPILDAKLPVFAASLILLRVLSGLSGRGVQKIVKTTGPNGGEQRYREPPIYGLKAILIRIFNVPGFTNVQRSLVSGSAEPEKTAAQMRTPASILKTIAAFILGR